MHPALTAALSRALSARDDGSLDSATLASGQVVGLNTRRARLTEAMLPAGERFALAILATLGAMPTRTEPNEEAARGLAAQDAADLAPYPAFALSAAVRAYRLAEIGDGKWRPTAGMLAKEASRRAAPFESELWRIRRVLDSEQIKRAPRQIVSKARIDELRALAAAGVVVKTGEI